MSFADNIEYLMAHPGMRARYNDARALGVPAIDAVRYAVHRNLCLCIKWHWRTGLEVAVRRDASAATPSE